MRNLQNQSGLYTPRDVEPFLRDITDVMAYGFLSLSKGRTAPIFLEGKKVTVRVTANATYGMASIWDWDVIIGLVSLINGGQNSSQNVSRKVAFKPGLLLRQIGRSTGGQNYRELAAAIRRLRTTSITTNIRLNDQSGLERPLSFIEDYTIPFRYGEHGRNHSPDQSRLWEVTLPRWIYVPVECQNGILSIDPSYFGLKSGIERFLYRYARKSVPEERKKWSLKLSTLHTLSGACGRLCDFEKKLHQISRNNTLPGYRVELNGKGATGLVFLFLDPKPTQSDLAVTRNEYRLSGRPDVLSGDCIPY